MWSQWPWVSSTDVTPERRAHAEQPVVLVGRVDQHRLAASSTAHDVDVVGDRSDDEAVDLGGGVGPDDLYVVHATRLARNHAPVGLTILDLWSQRRRTGTRQ